MTTSLEKKRRAIRNFKERILSSGVGDRIAKVILYGSLIRKEATAESDIDVLIITLDSLREVQEAASGESYRLLVELDELIEPMVCSIDEWRYPTHYFEYRTKEVGEEIYSMEREEIKRRESEGYLDLARDYLENARLCLQNKGFRASCDLAYNACELCVKGLLLFEIDDLPTSHGGIVSKFGMKYVETGRVGREMGRRLHRGLETRGRARYRFHMEVTEEDARQIMALAEELADLLVTRLSEIG